MPDALKVLIVDDDVLDRQAARRALLATNLAVEITEAGRGSEAFDMLTQAGFDAVLLDFQLPDANGLEILQEMAARGIASPVLMLTGNGDDLTAVKLMKAGAADYLPKSALTAQALERSLTNSIRIRHAEAESARAESDRLRLLENLAAEQGQLEAILTSMTDGLVISDLSGNVLSMNPSALKMHGFETLEEARQPLAQFKDIFDVLRLDGTPLPFDQWPLARVLNGETFAYFEVAVQRRDTRERWVGSFSGAPVRSKTGETILAILSIRDITEIKRAQERAAFLADASARLSVSLNVQTTLDTIGKLIVPALADWCFVTALEPDGQVLPLHVAHADPEAAVTALELRKPFPLNPMAEIGVGYVLRTGEPQLISEVTESVKQAAASEPEPRFRLLALDIHSYICVPLKGRGRVLGALTLASTQRNRSYDEDDAALALELGRRVAAALDNARLFEEVRARAEREALINKIGSALRVTLDADEILEIVTEQVGLALGASRCRFARLSARRDTLETALGQYAVPDAPRIGEASPLTEWPAETIDTWVAGQPVAITGTNRASLACPVFLRGKFGGIFLVEQTDRARVWTPEEITFLSGVTDILALALENARLYAREHRVADMLSSAFLTDIPDELPGLRLAANYRAGLEESRVGGDYYDAFALPDGRAALIIADVSGKGLNAAVQTATVKYSLRAFATEAGAPGLVLTRLNRMLCSDLAQLGDHFVTLFYAVFEPNTGHLAWASAGHETMLIKRASGGTEALESTGPILGLAEHSYGQQEAFLAIGDSLVLYTDGLTEARNTDTREMLEIEGVRSLVETASSAAFPGALAAYIQAAAMQWTQGQRQDDMALLVVRRLPLTSISDRVVEAVSTLSFRPVTQSGMFVTDATDNRAGDALFDFRFPSRPHYAAEVRQAVGHWMPTLGFDKTATEDFQTAVTEAVTNAVRHGSPAGEAGEFRVRGLLLADGALSVEVTDSGLGLLPPQTRMPGPEALGGRGLPLMRELSDAVEFSPAPAGLSVTLLKRLS